MQNINYVDIDFIMEKYNEDKLPNTDLKEHQAKEWIYESLRKIGSMQLFEQKTEILKVVNNQARVPGYINNIINIRDKNNNNMVLEQSEYNRASSKIYYMLRGRVIRLSTSTEEIHIDYLGIPTDEKGSPLVLDNTYVISAVLAYLHFKIAKKLWITNRLSPQKYMDFEQEWLFYVNSASEAVDTPSFDDLESWDSLFLGFPLNRMRN